MLNISPLKHVLCHYSNDCSLKNKSKCSLISWCSLAQLKRMHRLPSNYTSPTVVREVFEFLSFDVALPLANTVEPEALRPPKNWQYSLCKPSQYYKLTIAHKLSTIIQWIPAKIPRSFFNESLYLLRNNLEQGILYRFLNNNSETGYFCCFHNSINKNCTI